MTNTPRKGYMGLKASNIFPVANTTRASKPISKQKSPPLKTPRYNTPLNKQKLSELDKNKDNLKVSSSLKPGRQSGLTGKSLTQAKVIPSSKKLKRFSPAKNNRVGALRRRSQNKVRMEKDFQVESVSENKVATIAELQKDKSQLEHQISELVRNAESKKAEIAQLKIEISKLKEQNEISCGELIQELETLQAENHRLKQHLMTIGNPLEQAALSDTEKELLLQKKCNSAPPSIICGYQDGSNIRSLLMASKSDGGSEPDIGDVGNALYATPDWDKQSSSSLSEMSVACLQDRILQMEETHYSTNEELQATLQELTDLQDQLTELQAENERLSEEKAVLLESLCSQTEKLEDCRSQNDHLRQLFLEQGDERQKTVSLPEREGKLLELLKSCQKEKDSLLAQQRELNFTVQTAQEKSSQLQQELISLQNHITALHSSLNNSDEDRKHLEKQASENQEEVANLQLEINKMKTLLENERIKVMELEQAREIADKSELDELLDNARKEKDRMEALYNDLCEQLTLSQSEAKKLKEQLSLLQDEVMVTKNNSKKQLSDLEYKLKQQGKEKEQIRIELKASQESVHELERKCQRHLEDKRELRTTICDLQKKAIELTAKLEAADQQMREAEEAHQSEIQDWKQFQDDLLMTVRVANEFKTEAQQDLERLIIENKQIKEKLNILQTELERSKISKQKETPASQHGILKPANNLENPVLSSMEQEIVTIRKTRSTRSDTRPLSVKSLIESIENAAKQVKAFNGNTRTSSTSSTGSSTSDKYPQTPLLRRMENDVFMKLPVTNDADALLQDHSSSMIDTNLNKVETGLSPGSKSSNETDAVKSVHSPISILTNKLEPIRRNSYSDILDKKDPLAALVRGGGSKRNALLKWCQNKVIGYKGIDITNFSSSWNDGLAFCALLHTYLPDKIPYDELDTKDKRRNFTLAFKAAESVGIPCNLNIQDMISVERPDWQAVMGYITAIYKHFET